MRQARTCWSPQFGELTNSGISKQSAVCRRLGQEVWGNGVALRSGGGGRVKKGFLAFDGKRH